MSSLWGPDHDSDYQKVLQFYVRHPFTLYGPPPKHEFLPVGTKVEIVGDLMVTDGAVGWVREIGDDGYTAWISEEHAEYDGTAPWGIWCSWRVLRKKEEQ